MAKFKTPQEDFWSGNFGDNYIDRNKGEYLLASNINFFSKAFHQIGCPKSIIEFGANIGMNLQAISCLYPGITSKGVEINQQAADSLATLIGRSNVFCGSIFDYPAEEKFEIAMIKGVLIHINPDMLPLVYEKLYNSSSKYILIAEYYNPSPVSINYRGHTDRLFKRDFAGEMLDKYSNLELFNYGFAYKRDTAFPQDDITWFLLKKK